ncbi:MAG TPA: sulfurtransferase [Rhodocyclaceae bacterium]|nr:sulfurtransferase [Rhodocyclaceae bacterium]
MSFSTLVDAATLAAHLEDPDWVVCDVRHQLADTAYGERVYAEGHIPGAVFLHCDRDLSGPMNGRNGRHPLPEVAAFCERMAALGINRSTQVVAYDDSQGMISGRLWWLLRALGHQRVAVLDGGWQAWLTGHGAVDSRPSTVEHSRYQGVSSFSGVVDAGEVLAHLESPALCLVDARSPDRFRGENETIDPVGGHIPGARNRFFRDNLGIDGRLKPAGVLRAEWLAVLAGADPAAVVHQCGSGVSACLNQLAMEVAGLSGSRLYAGSWSEWCSDPVRPVALN